MIENPKSRLWQIKKMLDVKDMQSRSEMTWSGVGFLWSERELTTKVEEQPWPQFVYYVSIFCCVCGCIFQED